ncbi:hypothetical protein AOLI_G00064210 [Acnodon oligacanthus]
MGEHVIDPSAEKAKDTVKTMEYKMRHLIDQIQYISKQQGFQRDREETFRQMSEETNGNVLWWAIIQTLILLTRNLGIWLWTVCVPAHRYIAANATKKIEAAPSRGTTWNMSHWMCCNSCFKSPGPDRQLAVTNCGHIICNVCFKKGKEGECLICKAKCQLSPLSDKSCSEVKALFSDINIIAAKYLSEISKVLQFQARHQRRLLTHYQQKSEKIKETVIKMQGEMQQMSKKITEQSAYISKLEVTLQHQSSRLAAQSYRDVRALANFKPVSSGVKIPYSSPVSLSHHLSTTSLIENMEVDSRGFSSKPEISGSVSRLCVISPPQDGRIDEMDQSEATKPPCTVPHRAASHSSVGSHSVRSATVSREFSSSLKEPMLSSSNSALYRRESPWESPIFKLAPAYKYPSTSSLGPPP